MPLPSPALAHLTAHEAELVADLKAFVRIPSVSASPDHATDICRAADWVMARMTRAGLEHVALLESPRHPAVYAEWIHAGDAPTVLIYGHYDVQPAEPLDLWTTPAFEPEIRDGRLYGRGTADDKGGVAGALATLEAMLTTGDRPGVNVKLLIEGEEEIGSPNIGAIIARERTRLACDFVISVDGGQWSPTQPDLALSLRGMCVAELHVSGPTRDLHSGIYGGRVWNPLEVLARLLASMRAPDGRITVAGFYDDVVMVSDADRAAMAQIPDDEAEVRADIGVSALHGEAGFTTRESGWVRPTLEINGMGGGHQGAGTKTIIPAEAHAKLTCRLVAHQDPARIFALLEQHVATHIPAGATARLEFCGGADAWSIARDHPVNRIAAEVLTDVYGVAPYETRSGGSVPVLAVFQHVLGVPTLSHALGISNSNIHSPDEFTDLATLHRGCHALALMLQRYRDLPRVTS